MTLTILFIGCGNMGAAIAGGALRNLAGARLVALDPDVARARSLLHAGASVELSDRPEAVEGLMPDLVVLGVKPQSFSSLAAEVMATLSKAPVVSIMAGVPLARLTHAIGHERVIRVMPNLPALIGAGMSLGCRAPGVQDNETDTLVAALFSAIGRFDWCADEVAFEEANPVFACGPGFVFAIAEQMVLGAVANGVPAELADRLVRQTLFGAAKMLAEDDRDAQSLKRAVSSPGGTTLAGLAVLEAQGGLPDLMARTYGAAHARALELAALS
jgi:pyrroline-5-carboxylate reductase